MYLSGVLMYAPYEKWLCSKGKHKHKHKHTENGQTDFAAGVDVWIEATSPSICCDGLYTRSGVRVIVTAFDLELEEAKFIWRVWCTDYEGTYVADIVLKKGHRES